MVSMVFLGPVAAAPESWTPATPDWTQGFIAVVVVLALAAGFAWLLKRGLLGPLGRRRQRAVTAETVALLGDRRSLVVVTVEGRRLLLGLTPSSVRLVAELDRSERFEQKLDEASAHPAGSAS